RQRFVLVNALTVAQTGTMCCIGRSVFIASSISLCTAIRRGDLPSVNITSLFVMQFFDCSPKNEWRARCFRQANSQETPDVVSSNCHALRRATRSALDMLRRYAVNLNAKAKKFTKRYSLFDTGASGRTMPPAVAVWKRSGEIPD